MRQTDRQRQRDRQTDRDRENNNNNNNKKCKEYVSSLEYYVTVFTKKIINLKILSTKKDTLCT